MDVTRYTAQQMRSLQKFFHAMNRMMVFFWKIGLGKAMNMWPSGFGRIMVIKHRGRRSGREYLTPVNYALVEGEIYCTAGFGSVSDWYRNLLANPKVELWLPEGRKWYCAEDVSDSPGRLFLLRQVIIASGFAGPLLGIDQRKLNDKQLDEVTREYRLVHFTEAQMNL